MENKGYRGENDNAISDILTTCAFILLMILGCTLGGCGSSRGWRFEIGVSPVSNLHNQAGLTEQNENEDGGKNGRKY